MKEKTPRLETYLLLGPISVLILLIGAFALVNGINSYQPSALANVLTSLIKLTAVSMGVCITWYIIIQVKKNRGNKIFGDKTIEVGNHQLRLASFSQRLLAHIADSIFIGPLVGMIVFVLLMLLGYGEYLGDPTKLSNIVLLYLVSYGLRIVFLGFNSTTIGKALFGIKVVDKNGDNINWSQSIIRVGISYISGIIIGAGYWKALFDKERRTFHDDVANTYVVKSKERNIPLTIIGTIMIIVSILLFIALLLMSGTEQNSDAYSPTIEIKGAPLYDKYDYQK